MLKVGTAAVLLPVLAAGAGRAGTAVVPAQVTPAVGMPMTTFLVSFVSPVRTGVIGSIRLRYLLTAASVAPGKDCLAQISAAVPDARRGQRVRVALAPESLGGSWCTGSYRGIVRELQTAVCPHGSLCPTYVILRGTVARFPCTFEARPHNRAGISRRQTSPAFKPPSPARPARSDPDKRLPTHSAGKPRATT